MAQWDQQISAAVGLEGLKSGCSGRVLMSERIPRRPADEELTSSGTMAERGEAAGSHRPGDRHTMVFDPRGRDPPQPLPIHI